MIFHGLSALSLALALPYSFTARSPCCKTNLKMYYHIYDTPVTAKKKSYFEMMMTEIKMRWPLGCGVQPLVSGGLDFFFVYYGTILYADERSKSMLSRFLVVVTVSGGSVVPPTSGKKLIMNAG